MDPPEPVQPPDSRVLHVRGATLHPEPWVEVAGFRLRTATGMEAAARLLGREAFDVVVIDADALDGRPERLLSRIRGASLLVRGEPHDAELADTLETLGEACLLPASAPQSMQVRLVSLAAQRSRLVTSLGDHARELHGRATELEQARTRFRDVIERNADAILVVDRGGEIRFANTMAAHLFGHVRERLIGTPFGFPVVAGETTELDLLGPEGQRVVEMRVAESEWEGRDAYIATLRDVTEQKRAEEAARSLIREQTARSSAERAARRFRFMADASRLLSLPLEYTETLSTLAGLCVRDLADWAVIYALDETGAVQRLEVAHRDPARADAARALKEMPISPESANPVLSVLRTRQPSLLNDVDGVTLRELTDDERHLRIAEELGVTAILLVPLVARDREIGAIGLISSEPGKRFTEEDQSLASDLALHAALAVDNARLYREAQRANQAKSDLLAVISHDLRTPLNAIIGHSDLLTMGIPEALSEPCLQRVERIKAGATHLLFLIDQLLSYARLESGREEIYLQDTNANAIALEVVSVAEPLANERGLTLRLKAPSEKIGLRTDPDRVRQILLNLVGNAIKYTERGEVRLELRLENEDQVVFSVRDTGVGLSPEHLPRIFDPFWQVDPTQRSRNGGTGLGLSVVRRITRLLGGDVSVTSTLGAGSTFTVRLPRSGAAATPVAQG